MKAKQFDELFDAGVDMSDYVDWSKARRPNLEKKIVNVALPVWMIRELDIEAARLGIPRQSLIKTVIARHLDGESRVEKSVS